MIWTVIMRRLKTTSHTSTTIWIYGGDIYSWMGNINL
jgi:hypothetical protein